VGDDFRERHDHGRDVRHGCAGGYEACAVRVDAGGEAGAVVKVINPKRKWKKFTNDALGNLGNVHEPRPGGGTAYETGYTYSELGKLLTVTMSRPGKGTKNAATMTQTRTWVYVGNQRLSTVVHPESSTTAKPSTTFAYNSDGTVLWKTDSKEQKIGYTCRFDELNRVAIASSSVGCRNRLIMIEQRGR